MNNVNKKSFMIVQRIRQSFSMIINDFAVVTTFLFRIKDKISFTFIMSLLTKATTTMRVKRVRLTFGTVKLIQSTTETFNLKRVKITYSIKETLKFILSIGLKHRITWGMSQRQKVVTNLGIKKVKITFVPDLRTFIKLSTLDPQTLSTFDAGYLGSMDYTGYTP